VLGLITQARNPALQAEQRADGPSETLRVAADRPLAHPTDAEWPHVPLTPRRAAI
jgi:hypothetical protein